MPKGFTLKELMIMFFILTIAIVLIVPTALVMPEKARQAKCKANLEKIGKSIRLYVNDCGRGCRSVYFPFANGAGFLTTLYQENILRKSTVYLCPSTTDKNSGKKLALIVGGETKNNFVSYTGRMNANQLVYPGFFNPSKDIAITTMSSDDTQEKPNHENGNLMLFLFAGGHVEHIRSKNANWDNYSYNFDPLTN